MDTLSNMLINIKNAGRAGKPVVFVPYSGFKFAVGEALLREGFIAGLARRGKGVKRLIEITLAYHDKKPKIQGVKRVSKPSRRVYHGVRSIKRVRQGFGHTVLSTPKGVITAKEARKEKVGGEVLFEIW